MNLQLNNINYKLLYKAKKYYSDMCFEYIEIPWVIPIEPMLITTTIDKVYSCNTNENFIGSGEQSFLNQALQNNLKIGKVYQTITPCFRKDEIDQFHSNQFIKLELFYYWNNTINLDDTAKELLEYILERCYNFYSLILLLEYNFDKLHFNLQVIKIDDLSFDINLNGIEIGSYGIRKFNDLTWIYATGLALPRFTQAIEEKYK